MDNDVSSAASVRKAWDGLRPTTRSTSRPAGMKDASGNYINTDAAWRDYVRGARKLMG